MKPRLKKFYIHIPGIIYAMEEYGLSKREALNNFKRKNYLNRMPKNFSIWEA
jgi:hypothetical protein